MSTYPNFKKVGDELQGNSTATDHTTPNVPSLSGGEETELLWIKRAEQIAKGMRVSHIHSARISDYMTAINDFKTSLRAEIEKLPNDGVINGRKKGRQALLDLIDTLKPLTPVKKETY